MILADTSVWIDHLRYGNQSMARLLGEGLITTHPFVVGELACGHLPDRSRSLWVLELLPSVSVATDAEVREFIESKSLMGRGLGYVDMHLLASIRLDPGCWLWTGDARLGRVAGELGVAVRGMDFDGR